ncbi:MAG: hypothetical protein FAF03_07660 [Epsilonproteobacteria bacterium]|nr:hypothetical protein [Campylobacterota bacterium]
MLIRKKSWVLCAKVELLKTLKGHTNSIESVAISQDAKYIVSGSWDNNVKIWERESGKLLKTLEGHTDNISSVAISQDTKYIVSSSWDSSIKIWDRESGKLLKEMWGGADGCWLSKNFETTPPIFYRGDDGTFLLKKRELYSDGNNSAYALEPVYIIDTMR